MSAAARAAIAAAANTVDGINCSPYFLQSTRAGDAMVRLDRIEYPNKFGGVVRWQVVVVLQQDYVNAEKQLDLMLLDLVNAVRAEIAVTTVTPQQLQTDAGLLPVVVVEGTRETETEE